MQSPVIIGDRADDEVAFPAFGMDNHRGPHRVRWEGDVR
jgi:hypothetical protein